MVLVAVAGGSSPTLGRSIVTAILATGKHEAVVLSRKRPVSEEAPPKVHGARVIYVDYDSRESLTSALDGVHTLISVLKINDPKAMINHHASLLEACITANVSRFAPSDWSLGPSSHSQVDLLKNKDELWSYCAAAADKYAIACADFQIGGFMNYFGQGKTFADNESDRSFKQFALGGLEDDLLLEYINIPAGRLVVPTNDQGKPSRITMTHLDDVGKFVGAAIDLPLQHWQGHIGLAGDTFSFDQVTRLLQAKGVQVRDEVLNTRQCDESVASFDAQLSKEFSLDALKGKMVAQMMRVQCLGESGAAVVEPKLNQLCPHIKPVSIEEYINRVY